MARRAEQKAWLRKRWANYGLPGTLTFHHVFKLESALDHEAMRRAGMRYEVYPDLHEGFVSLAFIALNRLLK